MWNYEKIGSDMVLKMMLIDGIREPTLTQIQDNSDEENFVDNKKVKNIPAWRLSAERHPGLPEHYHTINYSGSFVITSKNDDDLHLPKLPYSLVNRTVSYKLLVSLTEAPKDVPKFEQLINGTIIITSRYFPNNIVDETEIFLNLHEKLLPCFYTASMDDIIIESPYTVGSRVRCYYLVIPSAIAEVTFIDSNGNVIYRCGYQDEWLHGSTSYHRISEPSNEFKM